MSVLRRAIGSDTTLAYQGWCNEVRQPEPGREGHAFVYDRHEFDSSQMVEPNCPVLGLGEPNKRSARKPGVPTPSEAALNSATFDVALGSS